MEKLASSEAGNEATTEGSTNNASLSLSQKRKLSGDQPSHDAANGLLAPANSADWSRSPSTERTASSIGPRVYNGILQRKEGRIIAKSIKKLIDAAREDVATINSMSGSGDAE